MSEPKNIVAVAGPSPTKIGDPSTKPRVPTNLAVDNSNGGLVFMSLASILFKISVEMGDTENKLQALHNALVKFQAEASIGTFDANGKLVALNGIQSNLYNASVDAGKKQSDAITADAWGALGGGIASGASLLVTVGSNTLRTSSKETEESFNKLTGHKKALTGDVPQDLEARIQNRSEQEKTVYENRMKNFSEGMQMHEEDIEVAQAIRLKKELDPEMYRKAMKNLDKKLKEVREERSAPSQNHQTFVNGYIQPANSMCQSISTGVAKIAGEAPATADAAQKKASADIGAQAAQQLRDSQSKDEKAADDHHQAAIAILQALAQTMASEHRA